MSTFKEKSFNFNNLMIIPSLLLASIAQASEHYAATVEDGTAQVISATTKIDETQPADEFVEESPSESPVKSSHLRAPKASRKPKPHKHISLVSEIDALKRQNESLQKRITDLEKARQEAKEEASADIFVDNDKEETEISSDQLTAEETEAKPAIEDTKKPEHPKVASSPKAKDEFDSVPSKHIGELTERLKYVDKLLVFGRAYDYRTNTTSELKKILAQLNATGEKTKKSKN